MTTYRYYSIGLRDGAWTVLGWSRDIEHAMARPGTRFWAYASTREQAARRLRKTQGIIVSRKKF